MKVKDANYRHEKTDDLFENDDHSVHPVTHAAVGRHIRHLVIVFSCILINLLSSLLHF